MGVGLPRLAQLPPRLLEGVVEHDDWSRACESESAKRRDRTPVREQANATWNVAVRLAPSDRSA